VSASAETYGTALGKRVFAVCCRESDPCQDRVRHRYLAAAVETRA